MDLVTFISLVALVAAIVWLLLPFFRKGPPGDGQKPPPGANTLNEDDW